jgi:hypothetical protein
MQKNAGQSPGATPALAYEAIQRFLAASRTPVLIEPGEDQFPLQAGSFDVSLDSGRLTIQVWDDRRNLVRKVTRVLSEQPGKLELEIARFGKKLGTLQLLDLDRPKTQIAVQKSHRLTWREQFRRHLSREFPGWRIVEISAEADLHHSLSPNYPRAFLRKGSEAIAAISASPSDPDPTGVLSFALIWHSYLQQRDPKLFVNSLCVFLPAGKERPTCLRVRYLRSESPRVTIYAYTQDNYVQVADVQDIGNLDTTLRPRTGSVLATSPQLAQLSRSPNVETIETSEGALSFRVRGFEFARYHDGRLTFGLETKRPGSASNLGELEELARQLAVRRNHDPVDINSSLYQRYPEFWLESQVRANIPIIDANLHTHPLYGQVAAFAGADRGIIDLLAIQHDGRLAILELKVTEEIQ